MPQPEQSGRTAKRRAWMNNMLPTNVKCKCDNRVQLRHWVVRQLPSSMPHSLYLPIKLGPLHVGEPPPVVGSPLGVHWGVHCESSVAYHSRPSLQAEVHISTNMYKHAQTCINMHKHARTCANYAEGWGDSSRFRVLYLDVDEFGCQDMAKRILA